MMEINGGGVPIDYSQLLADLADKFFPIFVTIFSFLLSRLLTYDLTKLDLSIRHKTTIWSWQLDI